MLHEPFRWGPSVYDHTAKQARSGQVGLFQLKFHKNENSRGKCIFAALPPAGFMEAPNFGNGATTPMDSHQSEQFCNVTFWTSQLANPERISQIPGRRSRCAPPRPEIKIFE